LRLESELKELNVRAEKREKEVSELMSKREIETLK